MRLIKLTLLFASFLFMFASATVALFEQPWAKSEKEPIGETIPLRLIESAPDKAASEQVTQIIINETNHIENEKEPAETSHPISQNQETNAQQISTNASIRDINLGFPIMAPLQSDGFSTPVQNSIQRDGLLSETREPEMGTLSIPKLSLDTQIVPLPNYGQGWNLGLIEKEVALLGETGRYPLDDLSMVFSGHVIDSWEFGPFFYLDRLMPEDQMSYTYQNQEFIYEVSKLMYVTPDRADLLYQNNGEQIILMTCSDYSFRSGVFEKRLLVIADLVDIQPVSENLGLNDENPIFKN